MILFPSMLFPGTRLATALSWDASNPGYSCRETRHAETSGDAGDVRRRAGGDAQAVPGHAGAADARPAAPRCARATRARSPAACSMPPPATPLRGASIWAGPTET